MAIAARSDVAALATLALLVGFLSIATWGTWGDLDSDTGYDVQAGERIADGQLPYRDFLYYYGPLAPALNGLAAFLGGGGFAPAIVLGFASPSPRSQRRTHVARIFVGPLGALIASAITAAVAFIPDDYSYVLPIQGPPPWEPCSCLCSSSPSSAMQSRRSVITPIAVGSVRRLLALTKPEPAVAGVVAVTALLIMRRRAGIAQRARVARRRDPCPCDPSCRVRPLPVSSLPRASSVRKSLPTGLPPGQPARRSRIPLRSELRRARREARPVRSRCRRIDSARPAARARRRLRTTVVAGTGVAMCVAVLASLARPEALRHGLEYAYGWIPAGVVIGAAFLGWHGWRRRTRSPRSRNSNSRGDVLSVLPGRRIRFLPARPLPADRCLRDAVRSDLPRRDCTSESCRAVGTPSARRTVAHVLAAAGMGLTVKDARFDGAAVSGPGGTIAETARRSGSLPGSPRLDRRETRPGDSIFVAPLMPGLYPCPTR